MEFPVFTKEIRALKIASVENNSNAEIVITFADPNFAPIVTPSHGLHREYQPKDGWYLAYVDGYMTFLPAHIFESNADHNDVPQDETAAQYTEFTNGDFSQDGDPYHIHQEYTNVGFQPSGISPVSATPEEARERTETAYEPTDKRIDSEV